MCAGGAGAVQAVSPAQDASVGGPSLVPRLHVLASRPRGLVRPEAFRLARRHVQDLVRASFEEGAAAENLTTMFYLAERTRDAARATLREALAPGRGQGGSLQTRAYVSPLSRSCPRSARWIGSTMRSCGSLVPGLESVPPFDKPSLEAVRLPGRIVRLRNGLMPRLPYVALRALVAARDLARPPRVEPAPYSPYDEESWLETNLDWARDVCLSTEAPRCGHSSTGAIRTTPVAGHSAPARRLFQYPIFATMMMFGSSGSSGPSWLRTQRMILVAKSRPL